MLTGDIRITAEAVARRLGVDRVEAEVLPGHRADVDMGIAMGTGTDVAIESAGVTLLEGS